MGCSALNFLKGRTGFLRDLLPEICHIYVVKNPVPIYKPIRILLQHGSQFENTQKSELDLLK